jgi:hypothetical protein
MKPTSWRFAILPACLLAAGTSFCAESPAPPSRAPLLDLRAPPIAQVMPPDELLAEIGTSDEAIEVVADPVLLPMAFDANPPLGIVDSVSWTVDHPTQAWRLFLPANGVPSD